MINRSTSLLPIILYNNPADYKIWISPEMFRQLEDLPTIQAVKESTRDISNVTRMKNAFGDRIAVLTGVARLPEPLRKFAMIHGKNFIGNELSAEGSITFQTFSPANLQELPELFVQATKQETDLAVSKEVEAYQTYRKKSGMEKAAFLQAIAEEIELLGSVLIERACAESGLPEGRIVGERGRTANQLRLFASVLEDGSWVEASIDSPLPDRKPAARPDIRKMLQPVGPVVVFTASNFPLAFSTAGGDTISALAAGNPVIVKVHPYHTGTNELVAGAIIRAAQKTGMPDGVFSSLNAIDFSVGQALVLHPEVKSVAFTGSFPRGKSLFELARNREEPIPVFAEMGRVNPVLLLPEKVKEGPAKLAVTIAGSINLGAGQFCTNPGVLIALKSAETDSFKTELASQINKLLPEKMLHQNISKNFEQKIAHFFGNPSVKKLAESTEEATPLRGKTSGCNCFRKRFYTES